VGHGTTQNSSDNLLALLSSRKSLLLRCFLLEGSGGDYCWLLLPITISKEEEDDEET